jgi:hypothetical protein
MPFALPASDHRSLQPRDLSSKDRTPPCPAAGASRRGRSVTDGFYFVPYRMRLPGGGLDARRIACAASAARGRTVASSWRTG